jgi:6-pyruvoyltetrahydropterin/6-carboxytetrahydropterin synthase
MQIWKDFYFDAGHHLPMLPKEHKCARPHGHSYRMRLYITGEIDPTTGWLADYGGVVRAAGELICHQLDHRDLNGIEGLENPTVENLGVWILQRIQTINVPANCAWSGLDIQETHTAGVEIRL